MAVKKTQKDVLAAVAADLRGKEVGRLTFDPITAKGACRDGLAKLKAHRATLGKRYPGFDLGELDALPELCDRIAAEQRTVQLAARGGSVRELLPVAQAWRRKLLPVAQGLAESGAIDGKQVSRIMQGSGTSDLLRDVVDLAALLAPQRARAEAIIGAGALAEAAKAAQSALSALGQGSALPEEAEDAAERRDRYATLVTRRHDRLRAAVAAVTSWREAETLVPSLSAGKQTGKKVAPQAPVTPS